MTKVEKVKISDDLKVYRVLRHLLQKDIAEALGLSQRTISYVEKCKFSEVSDKTLLRIQEYLQKNQ
ncbi:MAG: helix-turn-helix transcriptional regulator [Endomicrobiaceae bacterium]